MNPATEILLSFLVLAGGIFTFIGSLGLARFRDFYTRLHGPTKATTLGVGNLLIASTVFFTLQGSGPSLHELLVTLFLFITAPVSAHLLAKAALYRRVASLAAPDAAALAPGADEIEAPEALDGDVPGEGQTGGQQGQADG